MFRRGFAVSRLASAWDSYEFATPNRPRGRARTGAASAPFASHGRRAAAGRARGVPIHLPPVRDIPGVALRVEIAGVPDAAMLSAGQALPSGLWMLEREDLAGLRLLPAGADHQPVGPASLEVTFVATDRATGRVGSMTTTLDIPGAWPEAGDSAAGALRYSLAEDAGGRFEIDPVSGLVAVANEALLDPANAPRHRIAVRMVFADGQVSIRHYEIELLGEAGEFAVTELWDRNAGRRPVRQFTRPGTVVGTVSVPVDVDAMDVLRFRLLDDAEGRFAIDPWNGVVTVADAALLDSEPGARHVLTVEVVSADGWMSVQRFAVAPGETDGSFVVTVASDEDESGDNAAPWLAANIFLPRSAA